MKINNKIVIGIVIIIGIALILVIGGKMGKKSQPVEKEKITNSTIDVNDEAYKDKKIYEKDGDVIIENQDGSKTIETKTTLENPDLRETSKETKEKYELSNIEVKKEGSSTKVTGKVKNKDSNSNKIVIQSKFYSQEDRIKGTASTTIEQINKGETKDFTITIRGDMTSYTHKIEISYTN